MDRTLLNIQKNYRRSLFAFVAMVFVLIASCSVKSSIKSLVGIPLNSQQGVTKTNHSFFSNGSEKCVNGETTDTEILQSASSQTNSLLPALILTAAFLFLLGYTFLKEQSHPLYGTLKIPGTLPIFLQYRKLII